MFLLLFLLTPVLAQEVTRDQALAAIGEAELIIQEMEEAGFMVNYVNDRLSLANQALERADFAELIRTGSHGYLAEQAKKALEGLDYQGFTYEAVLEHTQEISSRKEEAYRLSDSIRATELKIEDYKEQRIETSETEEILQDAKTEFEKERYEETDTSLSQANANLEEKKAEVTTVNILISSSKSYVQKRWREITVAAVIIALLSWFAWEHFKIKRVDKKLEKLNAEKDALTKLMKKVQTERFKKGELSEHLYKL